MVVAGSLQATLQAFLHELNVLIQFDFCLFVSKITLRCQCIRRSLPRRIPHLNSLLKFLHLANHALKAELERLQKVIIILLIRSLDRVEHRQVAYLGLLIGNKVVHKHLVGAVVN